MFSKNPASLLKLGKREVDMEILRLGKIAELDAINLYEQLATSTTNEGLRKVLLDIAREEKTHFGEFQALLLELDKEQAKELEKGAKEVEETRKKSPSSVRTIGKLLMSYKCQRCGRVVVKPVGNYYCQVCGPAYRMRKI